MEFQLINSTYNPNSLKDLIIDLYNKKYLAQAKLVGEPIDDYKLCNDLDITLENLENIRIVINQEVVSINKPVADDSETELSEFIASDKNLVEPPEDKLATDELVAVLRTVLLPVEYYILSERILFSSRRLEDISSEFFVTRQWISQTEIRAKDFLNKSISLTLIFSKLANSISE